MKVKISTTGRRQCRRFEAVLVAVLFLTAVAVLSTSSPAAEAKSSASLMRRPRQYASTSVQDAPLSSNVQHVSNYAQVAKESPSPHIARGGGGGGGGFSFGLSESKLKELQGVVFFLLADVGLRDLFQRQGIKFPSNVAGSGILCIAMILLEAAKPGSGDAVFTFLQPGANLLAKWLPVMFVPGLAMLPFAPTGGSALEFGKILLVVLVGFFYTLSTTAFAVLGLRTFQGKVRTGTIAAAPTAAPPKPYTNETLQLLVKGAVITCILSIVATRLDWAYKTPMQSVFMMFTTLASFVWGARFPASITKVVHPLLTSCVTTQFVHQLTGWATGSSFRQVLQQYRVGSLDWRKTGAGDVLLFLLGPTVVSLAIAMYSRKQLAAENFLVVATAIAVSSLGGLFGTALFVRLIQLGGRAGTGAVLRLSVLGRNVTTALAIAIAEIMGGDLSIAAVVVCLTGILGATFGGRILTKMGIRDPVARGLGIGSAAQGLGVASFIHEKDAFPFAAIAMVLTAFTSTTLASIPPIRKALTKMALGVNV